MNFCGWLKLINVIAYRVGKTVPMNTQPTAALHFNITEETNLLNFVETEAHSDDENLSLPVFLHPYASKIFEDPPIPLI